MIAFRKKTTQSYPDYPAAGYETQRCLVRLQNLIALNKKSTASNLRV